MQRKMSEISYIFTFGLITMYQKVMNTGLSQEIINQTLMIVVYLKAMNYKTKRKELQYKLKKDVHSDLFLSNSCFCMIRCL